VLTLDGETIGKVLPETVADQIAQRLVSMEHAQP
jgi:hypothetical protein